MIYNLYNTRPIHVAGWDTDQFMMDVGEATLVMLTVIKNVCRFNFTWIIEKFKTSWISCIELFIYFIAGRIGTRRIQFRREIVSLLPYPDSASRERHQIYFIQITS